MDLFEKFALVCLMAPLGNPNEVLTHWGVPFNVIGDSGAGKSSRLGQVNSALELACYPIYSSTKQPEHFAGVPVMGQNGFSVECILPQVMSAIDVRKATIFLDEISTAPEAVQAALLSFINERQVGEYILPPGVRIVLAMNPPDTAANGRELTIPMVNRMAHLPYTNPTLDQWGEFMDSHAPGGMLSRRLPSFKDAEAQVKKMWARHYEDVRHLTKGFLKANAGVYKTKETDANGNEQVIEIKKLHTQPDPDDPRAAGAWNSYRTWTMSVFAVTASRCLDMPQTLEVELVSRLIGEGLAVEWATYMAKEDIPPPEETMKDNFVIPKRMDIVRAIIGSAALFVVEMEKEADKYKWAVKCWKLLRKCMDKGYSDIVVQPIRVLCHADLDVECPNQAVQDAAEDVCTELNENGMLEYALKT